MRLALHAQTWGRAGGHPAGIGNIKELYYRSNIDIFEASKGIAKAGYEGFEAFDGDIMPLSDSDKKHEFIELLNHTGLKFVAMYCGANCIFAEVFDEEKYRINKAAEFAASLGCEILVVGGGAVRHDGIRELDYAELANGLDAIAEIASGAGLKSCYHPHMKTLVQDRQQVAKIMDLSRINLCPDTGHLLAGGSECLEVFQTYAARINYIHFKDFKQGKWSNLGRGEIDFAGLVRFLKQQGYEGWITVEEESAGREEGPLQTAIAAKEYMHKILQ